ncbi:SPOR domain-containing protein [Pedobacter mucosus]|uniref:HU domain-containing protein n=1 Tax=Pedobacter mucosus TaxID=2895286 RepID=UPI001EE4E379|nr:SPOR domain-containing protein [Pedobacter mucosus]UKT62455.1 SPOR domain-containing protein [Pedobacter mucosus]
MDILSYLLEFLRQRKEVGITDLGTFYKKKYPGRYDKEKQSFFPPKYTLQFTSELRNQDAFETFVSTENNVSTKVAQDNISQFVEEIKQKLELVHEAELENLGRLFYTEHEGLSFDASEKFTFGSEFYGLPPIEENENLGEEEIQEKAEPATIKTPNSAQTINKTVDNDESKNAFPIIENIELDEVKDDLKNTLHHTNQFVDEHKEVPTFIKEQHEEHPNRFGHTPESEEQKDSNETVAVPTSVIEQHEEHPNRFGHTPESEEHKDLNETVAVPASVIEQHEEHPNRFGHTPESEESKIYLNLEDSTGKEEATIVEAPEFIKEQHIQHPNRFGHNPIPETEVVEDNNPVWPKILYGVLILVIIGAIIYFVKPDLFNQQAETRAQSPVLIDSAKAESVDTSKIKLDSIAKTDSILRANQVQQKVVDTVKKTTVKPKTPTVIPEPEVVKADTGPSTFDVIAASFKTTGKAEEFVKQMKAFGLDAKIVKLSGRLKKVSIASFKTEEEARAQRPILSKKVKIKELDIIQINTTP